MYGSRYRVRPGVRDGIGLSGPGRPRGDTGTDGFAFGGVYPGTENKKTLNPWTKGYGPANY